MHWEKNVVLYFILAVSKTLKKTMYLYFSFGGSHVISVNPTPPPSIHSGYPPKPLTQLEHCFHLCEVATSLKLSHFINIHSVGDQDYKIFCPMEHVQISSFRTPTTLYSMVTSDAVTLQRVVSH